MKSESLAHKAYTELRRKILSAQIPPNTRLKEDYWAKKLAVSRMAIRETLTRLLGENLVSLGPKGGYFVNSMTPEDVAQIRELREVLEIGALRLACGKITKEQLARLEKICEDFSTMVGQGYYAGACEADLRFHETLMESAGNEKLLRAYTNSHIPLFHRQLTRSNSSEDDYELTDKEHRAIVQALAEKNLARAEEVLRMHFARGAMMIELE
ncbi:MAG TPA: GntR family transcriptional regulator [Cyclobacteriaceae bacterium]|nr:GntR family transcriptional regulator [Cyclobacteriaceae bacterium]